MGIKLSACTIAKNEELNIGKSIDSYKDYVDEIIIVDTGSIDKTAEIAESKGAKVLKFEWKNDFSAAKNFALDNATGDWIIFLDADEWFDGDSAKNIKEAIDSSIKGNYDSVACKLVNFYTETEVMETASTIRIFKHSDNIRFNRAIHETLFLLDKNIALPGLYTELLTINHSGYMKDLLDKKAKRNKELLDKHFALGNAAPIDYFYGMRENLKADIDVSEYFYKLIENTPDYDGLISTFNISTAIEETKLKVVNSLANKYSFEYRIKLLEEMQKKYPNNPMFKFYEYIFFESIDKKRAVKALQDAVEFDKNFAVENIANNNPFYGKRSEVYTGLGEYYIFINDKVQALDYFTKAIKADYKNIEAFFGLLYTISNEKSEDIILFIKSVYDIENKEVESFIVDALRLTKFKEVFLYYFVDYYKKYDEVDRAFFTSRLLTSNFEEMVDKYVKVYKESKDERALLMVAAALISGNCRDKYLTYTEIFTPFYLKLLNSYFENQKIEQITELEFQNILNIIREIAYIATDDILEKLLNISGVAKNRMQFELIKYYYNQYSYDFVLKWIEKFENNGSIEKDLSTYANYLKVNIYFRNNDFEKLPDVLDKVIYSGFLNLDIIYICEALEADDEKLSEYFELFDRLNFAKTNIGSDIPDDSSETIKFLTIDKLEEELSNKNICLVNEHKKLFFDFAENLKNKKVFSLAEKYYKISLKYGYEAAKSYYALGEIYNFFDKPELSYYCYEKAFIENFTLAKSILPSGHINRNYIFSKKKEVEIKKCPICGGESKFIKTYVNIYDEKLTYNEPVIVKYRSCNECNHLFASNDIAEKIYWDRVEKTQKATDDQIATAYDILESICENTQGTKILDCSNGTEFKMAAENYGFEVYKEISNNKFDVIFVNENL